MDISPVIDNKERHRFETALPDGEVAFVSYREMPAGLALEHTIVPEEWEGKGIAGAMVKQVLDQVREGGQQILPYCPYVATYLKRHPEYSDLVAKDFGAD